MPFYLRKALKLGPLRFNLSKSGLGLSAGVKGLRLGSGPRGNYVHMGRGGLYYRKSLGGGRKKAGTQYGGNREEAKEVQLIDSGDVGLMVDSSSEELLKEINAKLKRKNVWPAGAIAGIVLTLIAASYEVGPWTVMLVFLFAFLGAVYLHRRDRFKRTVVLLYDVDEDTHGECEALHTALDSISTCSGIWHVEGEGGLDDGKRHGGASTYRFSRKIVLGDQSPPFLHTNVPVLSLNVGSQTIYFLPDRLLIVDGKTAGAVSYRDLEIAVSESDVLLEKPDRDSKIVRSSWQYVNKDGGPDRRFKNNQEMFIVRREDIHFRSDSGLNEKIQISKTGPGRKLKEAVERLANVTQRRFYTGLRPPAQR